MFLMVSHLSGPAFADPAF